MRLLANTAKYLSIAVMIFTVLILGALLYGFSHFPSVKEMRGCIVTKMYKVHLCPGSPEYTRLADISPFLPKAVVLTEDSAFYQHHGFDFEEMQRSLKKNVETGHYARGGSTLSQQLAKNMFLTEEKTLTRKLFEALITMQMERHMTKHEILERYLNVVHWGKGIFGIRAAANYYFHKKPHDLDIVEAAFLTFLLPSPEKYSKSFMQKQLTPFTRMRIEQIIENMYRYQRITEDEYATAKSEMSAFFAATSSIPDPLEQELDSPSPDDDREDD